MFTRRQNRFRRLAGSIATSATIIEAYTRGFIGCFVDQEGAPNWARVIARRDRDRFRAEVPRPRAEDFMGEIQGKGAGQRAVNYQYYLELDRTAMTGNQNRGNCTAWSGRCVVGNLYATDILGKGEPHVYLGRPGTAVPYSFRGGMGEGMSVWRCARVFHQRGIQLMLRYLEKYDLREENPDEEYGYRWGRTGAPADLLEVIKDDRVETVSEISDPQAVMDALWAGYFIHVGSSRTASSSGDPISALRTPANHAEALIGYDDTDEFREWYREKTGKRLTEAVGIWDQSWGNWNTVTNWFPKWGPRPQGAFVLDWSDTMWKVRQTGIAYSNVIGFPAPQMDDWGSDEYL